MSNTLVGIYQIRNIVNGKVYIGSSVDIENRWRIHKHELNKNKHHSIKLQEAWNEYGESSFIFEILEEAENGDELHVLEQNYLDRCKPHIDGYNMSAITSPRKKYKLKKDVQSNDFYGETIVRRIGNSKGIILPTEILKDMNLSSGSTVNIIYKNKNIIIRTDVSEELEENIQLTFDEAILHIKEYLENNFQLK